MINKEKYLFSKGMDLFNNKNYYDAHEYWEELWLEYKLNDADFIQGLIQLSVSYFHFYNKNLNGAKSMINKALGKMVLFKHSRNIDVDLLKKEMMLFKKSLDDIEENLIDQIYCIQIKEINEG